MSGTVSSDTTGTVWSDMGGMVSPIYEVIEQEDELWFELYFAFRLRHLNIISELDEFLDSWNTKYNGGFSRFIDLLLLKYDPLFAPIKKKAIQLYFDGRNINEEKNNLLKPESVEDSDEINIDMNREVLTIAFIYYNKYHEIENTNNDNIRFLTLLIGKPLTKPDNSHFKNLVSKHNGAKYDSEKDLEKLYGAARLFESVGLTYISKFIQTDIEKIKIKINKDKR